MWLRPESALEPLIPQEDDSKEDMVEVDLFELVSAFKSVLERVRQRKDYTIEQYTVTLDEMISRIKGRIQPGASLRFEQLFDDVTTRELLIVTFLALLELVRVRVLTLYQQKAFGTIHVNRPSHAERKE
jgi:segregation and condensation protein A